MKRNLVVAVIIFVLALLASSIAWAHQPVHGHHGGFPHHGYHHGYHGHAHSRGRVDIIIGAPLPPPWPYRAYPYRAYPYYPYYYARQPVYTYPPAIVAPAGPPVYIQRGDIQGSLQQPQSYWHYCNNPQGYYPYVSNCPSGWQQVPAQPPPDLK